MTNNTQTASPDPNDTELDRSASAVPTADTLIGKVIFVLAAVLGLSAVVYLATRPIVQVRYSNLHLGGAILLFLFVQLYRDGDPHEWNRRTWLVNGGLAITLLAGVFATLYIEFFYRALAYERIGRYPFSDRLVGVLLITAVVVATKRAYGWMIALVTVFTILFAHFGPQLPGLLNHQGLGWNRIITMTTVEFNGVYHLILQIGATWIFVFIIWAGIVEEFGGLDTFIDIGFVIGQKFRSGVAQTAVVASMIMGSISGSPAANIAVTGSFTIPLMKERGLRPDVAAAIESVASTGGMVLPPVMGSVAFLMANFLSYTYAEIILIAALPALLYYAAVLLSVHLIVLKSDVDTEVKRVLDVNQIGKDIVPIAVSILTLVYLLLVPELPPGIAGVYTIGTLVAAELGKRLYWGSRQVDTVRDVAVDVVRGLRTGAIRMAPLTVTLAAMGIIISAFSITGTGYRLSLSIVEVSGGNTVLLLFLVMISAIVLGMGMPTVAAYLLTITLVAPAMTQVGFETITAHFFVFYFAMLAALTPPVALSAAVASQIAEAKFFDVAVQSMILGIPLFLLPYVFALNEALLTLSGAQTAITFLTALVGYVLLVLGLQGNRSTLRGRGVFVRVSLFGLGLVFVFLPYLYSKL